jgi:hypothetical protein
MEAQPTTKDDEPFRWGKPPERIAGAYESASPAPFGSFGPREAGSTLATLGMLQPVMFATSMAIEQLAEQANPAKGGAIVFGTAYFLQLFAVLILKVAANLLRNFGASIARDFGAWLWYHIATAIGVSIWDWFSGLRRPSPKPRPKPGPKPGPKPSPKPDNDRRRPVLDWLFPRRKDR